MKYVAKNPLTREALMERKKAKFLRILAENGCYVERACKEIGITRPALSYWRDNDETFAATMDAIKDLVVEGYEMECDRRAFQGVDKPITFKGEITGHYKEYSDNLLMFRLKALRPEVYRDGPGAGRASSLSDEELDQALGRLMKNKAAREKPVEVAGVQ